MRIEPVLILAGSLVFAGPPQSGDAMISSAQIAQAYDTGPAVHDPVVAGRSPAAAEIVKLVASVNGIRRRDGLSDVGDVAGDLGDVGDVASGLGDVGNVAGDLGDVGNVASGLGDVGNVASGLGNVGELGNAADDVTDAADSASNAGDLTGAANSASDILGSLGNTHGSSSSYDDDDDEDDHDDDHDSSNGIDVGGILSNVAGVAGLASGLGGVANDHDSHYYTADDSYDHDHDSHYYYTTDDGSDHDHGASVDANGIVNIVTNAAGAIIPIVSGLAAANAPAYTAPAYTAPEHTAQAYAAPAHTAPAYTAPAYTPTAANTIAAHTLEANTLGNTVEATTILAPNTPNFSFGNDLKPAEPVTTGAAVPNPVQDIGTTVAGAVQGVTTFAQVSVETSLQVVTQQGVGYTSYFSSFSTILLGTPLYAYSTPDWSAIIPGSLETSPDVMPYYAASYTQCEPLRSAIAAIPSECVDNVANHILSGSPLNGNLGEACHPTSVISILRDMHQDCYTDYTSLYPDFATDASLSWYWDHQGIPYTATTQDFVHPNPIPVTTPAAGTMATTTLATH